MEIVHSRVVCLRVFVFHITTVKVSLNLIIICVIVSSGSMQIMWKPTPVHKNTRRFSILVKVGVEWRNYIITLLISVNFFDLILFIMVEVTFNSHRLH